MSRYVFSALLLVSVGLSGVLSQDAAAPFSFYDYLLGEWDVARGSASLSSGEQTFETVVRGKYFFEKENGTMNVLGRYYDNDTSTGEITNEMSVVVEFSTPTEGVFKVMGSNDESAHSLFAFHFDQAAVNGLALAYGVWHAEKPTYYQFAVTSWDRFAITLIPRTSMSATATAATVGTGAELEARIGGAEEADAGPTVSIFLGKKVPVNVEKGFFAKYGSILMIGVFLIIQIKMRGGMSGMSAQNAQQAAAQRRRQESGVAELAGAGAGGAKKDKSTSASTSPSTDKGRAGASTTKPNTEHTD